MNNDYPGSFYGDEFIDLSKLLRIGIKYLPVALVGIAIGGSIGYLRSQSKPVFFSSFTLSEFNPAPLTKIMDPLESEPEKRKALASQQEVEPYLIIARSQGVMELTKTKLKNKGIDPDAVGFSIKNLPSTNFLAFEARSLDKNIVPNAATIWEQATIEYIHGLASETYQAGYSTVLNQYQNNKQTTNNLKTQVETIKPELEMKQKELEIKNSSLFEYTAELEKMESLISNAQIALPVLKEQIKKYRPAGPKEDKKESVHAQLEREINEQEILTKTLEPRRAKLLVLSKQARQEISLLQRWVSEQTVKLESMERDLEMAQKEYEVLYGRLGENRFVSAVSPSNLRHFSPPTAPRPVPRSKMPIFLGALAGLFLAALALFYRSSRHSLATEPRMPISPRERPTPKIAVN
ncbi:MAG: hypothetical protein HY401_06840 [Elusimicrobia bacterium]|nr:hypothetical protein [Elusimicrobiota bacterium]